MNSSMTKSYRLARLRSARRNRRPARRLHLDALQIILDRQPRSVPPGSFTERSRRRGPALFIATQSVRRGRIADETRPAVGESLIKPSVSFSLPPFFCASLRSCEYRKKEKKNKKSVIVSRSGNFCAKTPNVKDLSRAAFTVRILRVPIISVPRPGRVRGTSIT